MSTCVLMHLRRPKRNEPNAPLILSLSLSLSLLLYSNLLSLNSIRSPT